MVEETKNAPESVEDKLKDNALPATEDKQTAEAKVEAKPEAKEELKPEVEETTIGEALKKVEEEEKEKEKERMVPQSVLLEYKNQNKELKQDLKELKELIESGATRKEVSEDLRDIASEHNVDIEFLKKLATNIKQEMTKEMEEKFSTRIKPIEDKERTERMNKIFNEHFNKALEVMPDYKDIANKEVIKMLSLNPANANKTFTQIMQEAYGHLVSGKKTMEVAKGRGGEGITEINYDRAAKDMEYFNEIMADPTLKKRYNENLGKRLRF